MDQVQVNGGYGVISLFDGVSSIVPTLIRRFGYAPTVAVLAENDIDVRAVVCAEFGYRADGRGVLPRKDCCPLCKGCSFANSQQLPCSPKYRRLPWPLVAGGSPC